MSPARLRAVLASDARRVSRDGLLAWAVAIPLVLALAARLCAPDAVELLEARSVEVSAWLPLLDALAFAVVVPIMMGVVIGIMLVEEKQDGSWEALAVTPMSLSGYLAWRSAGCAVMGAVASLAGLQVSGLSALGAAEAAVVAVGAAPLAAVTAMALACLARSMTQCLAAVKLAMVLSAIPAIGLIGSPVGPGPAAMPEGMAALQIQQWSLLLALIPSWWPLKVYEAAASGGQAAAHLLVSWLLAMACTVMAVHRAGRGQ
ncbi:hypothetical protein ACSL103130_05625 [Actinomyces slackii]|uniref:Fluoroquinolones export permease protein Rv2686c/MT2760 n=1 Tax=Actinomyces slackii TaxID=52774 RepID=A0A3S4TCM8_9ACTO|nr:hypothetical protein [Actinomyces slackii]VEG74801.1 Fluoroquinolones export permease protein Rv2686c/MT2760 [Actinomyces slackii]